MIALSCIVVVCTVYALSLPAQTLACDKEEHTHTAECYDENNELICEKEEHTHNEDCNKQEEANEQEEVVKDEPETQNKDEQVSQESEEEETTTTTTTETTTETTKQPFDLSYHTENIESVKFVYKKTEIIDGKEKTTEYDVPTDGSILSYDTLDMTYKLFFKGISAKTLKECGGIIKYQLPNGFKIRKMIEGKTILSGGVVIGNMNVSTDGLVTITYNQQFLSRLQKNETLTGSFEVDAQIDMNKIDSSTGKVTITTPKGDITLNYGLDYKEHYGNVSVVDKSWEKEATSDYIKYTITLKAGDDGCKNLYVVDQFTQGKDLVKYEDINQSETPLKISGDNHQPYETRGVNLKAGTIYKTNAPSSDQKIPGPVTSISNPESFVWKIDEMNPNEIRKLTYYVKLIDTTQNLYHNKTNVVNNAQVYSKRDNSSQVYSKGYKESTFTPTININTSVMKKNIVKQDDNKDYKKDNDGNYLVNYQIEFNYGSENNVSIKKFQFADYLDYEDGVDFKTDSKMLPYISFVQDSIVLHVKEAGKTEYTEYKGDDISVKWAKENGAYSTTYKEDSTRFKVYELNNKSITINPGDSYYVTYTLKIKPEVYAAMQSNSVTIKNRYYTYSGSEELDKVGNRDLTLTEYKWVDKDVAKPTTSEETINMDGKKYNNQFNEDTSAEQSFKVPAGSYKYTVKLNKTDGKFNITDVTLTDTLDKDVMKYVGYMKIMAYDTQNNVVETKWVNIDKQQSFNLKLYDIDWTKNCYSYTFEYYATPNNLSSLTSAKVTNTFTLNGDVKRGVDGKNFPFTNVSSSSEVTLEGSYNLNVNKQAWYYEKPKQNATEWQNGKHYWVIEVNGSKIRKDTQIKDEISDASGKDEMSSYLHKDSLVGVYKGNLKTLSEYKTIDNLPEELRVSESYYTADYTNKKGFSGDNNYSELVLTTKQDFDLQENKKIYIVVKTEPQELPTEYRATSKYKNSVYVKHANDADFTKYGEASQELYGGNYILKELGQTFEYKNGKYTNISIGKDKDNPESKIVTKKLNGDGIYASWAFKVNYGGDLKDDYRVLETIPDGMELSYIRIKWTGKYAKNITSRTITDLGDWKEHTITAPDDDHSNITTYYYVNGKQALIQLGEFKGIHGRDDYSVDVQVVCRVTDPDVLLGGETKTFNNKVTLQSSDGTKDYVSANADAEISNIKILDKTNIHNDKSPKIDYTITANEYGQTLLKNTTDKLTLVDEMSSNLVLDPDSIKAKNIKDDKDVEIEKKYDPKTNILEIQIPDGTPVRITYTCKVKVAPDTETQVSNNVYWKNYGQTGGVNDEIKTFSYDLNASGTTETETHPQLKIIKYDDTLKRLSGAEFEIHECELVKDKIQYKSPVNSTTAISGTDGTVTIPTDKFQMKFNTIYEVKETKKVDGYILDNTPYYIMRAKKEDNGDYSDYVKEYIKIVYQNSKDKHYIVAYDKDYFLVKIYNAQQGITVKKQFTNNAAETEHNPISGTYQFGLYDNENGTGKPLEIIEIKYDSKDKDVKSEKFKNPIDLTKDYYVFEIGQNNQPIKAFEGEATINSMQYEVVYDNKGNPTNKAQVGDTVTVTNKSRTKILPSTGGIGTLIYRLLGATLVVVSVICLSNINKNNRKGNRRKK